MLKETFTQIPHYKGISLKYYVRGIEAERLLGIQNQGWEWTQILALCLIFEDDCYSISAIHLPLFCLSLPVHLSLSHSLSSSSLPLPPSLSHIHKSIDYAPLSGEEDIPSTLSYSSQHKRSLFCLWVIKEPCYLLLQGKGWWGYRWRNSWGWGLRTRKQQGQLGTEEQTESKQE